MAWCAYPNCTTDVSGMRMICDKHLRERKDDCAKTHTALLARDLEPMKEPPEAECYWPIHGGPSRKDHRVGDRCCACLEQHAVRAAV